MITISAKDIAKLINRRPKYVYILLRRKNISLTDIDLERVFDLVAKYRWSKYVMGRYRKIRIYNRGIKRVAAEAFVEQHFFSQLYREVKDANNGLCTMCGKAGEHVHHIDGDHWNMVRENMTFLCPTCHLDAHRAMRRSGGATPTPTAGAPAAP